MDRKFLEINKCFEVLQGLTHPRNDDLGFTTELPFEARILQEPLPKYFKMPHLEIYDGSTDPVDHL